MSDSADKQLYIDIARRTYAPGEMIEGDIFWVFDEPPGEIKLQLGWWTEGKGTKDDEIIDHQFWDAGEVAGQEHFAFKAPAHPYSFDGTLITIKWALELSANKGKLTDIAEIAIQPGSEPIRLQHIDKGRKW